MKTILSTLILLLLSNQGIGMQVCDTSCSNAPMGPVCTTYCYQLGNNNTYNNNDYRKY